MNIAFYVSGKAQRLKQIILKSNENVLRSINLIVSDCYNQELENISDEYSLNYKFIELELLKKKGGGREIVFQICYLMNCKITKLIIYLYLEFNY